MEKIKAILSRKEKMQRAYHLFSIIMWRLVPVMIFALLFAWIATSIDKHNYKVAPATDFLNYTQFSVTNAREGEDVYFNVCRDSKSNIHYDGDLNIYIIANAEQSDEKRIQTYSRDISGTIQGDCENKVIKASDFKHTVGTYEMGFCVRFSVKYGYEKEVCKTSNRYRIYAQPTDLESKIRDLEMQLESARDQLDATSGNINVAQDNSLSVPNRTPANTQANNGAGNNAGGQTGTQGGSSGSNSNNGNNGGGGTDTGVQPQSCSLTLIFGVGVGCGSDGLIRL
jgi:uncharacterized membrane protein YgcG